MMDGGAGPSSIPGGAFAGHGHGHAHPHGGGVGASGEFGSGGGLSAAGYGMPGASTVSLGLPLGGYTGGSAGGEGKVVHLLVNKLVNKASDFNHNITTIQILFILIERLEGNAHILCSFHAILVLE